MNEQGNEQGQQRGIGLVTYATPIPYDTNQHQSCQMVAASTLYQPGQVVAAPTLYQPSQVVAAPDLHQSNQLVEAATPNLGLGVPSAGQFAPGTSHPLSFHQPCHNQPQPVEHQLNDFWTNQLKEVEEAEFRNHGLPLARIKKIMKADEDVRMISAEAPVIFAKACEMFISELTLRSWYIAEENKRRTLQKNDIAAATARAELFDFLVDIVPREDAKEDLLGSTPQLTMPIMGLPDAFPYHLLPKQPNQVGISETMCSSAQQAWPPQGSDKPESSRNAQE